MYDCTLRFERVRGAPSGGERLTSDASHDPLFRCRAAAGRPGHLPADDPRIAGQPARCPARQRAVATAARCLVAPAVRPTGRAARCQSTAPLRPGRSLLTPASRLTRGAVGGRAAWARPTALACVA